jgi:hypothetical protein
MLKYSRVFVLSVMSMQFGAGICYLLSGEYKKAIFWFGLVVVNWTTL